MNNIKPLMDADAVIARQRQRIRDRIATDPEYADQHAPNVHMLFGLKIVVSDYLPKKPVAQLSERMVQLFHDLGHPEHIAPLNRMLRELGEYDVMIFTQDGTFVSPMQWAQIRHAVAQDDQTILKTMRLAQ